MAQPHIQAYDFLKNEATNYINDSKNIKTQITNNNTFKPNDATRNNNVMVIPTTVNMQPGASTKQLCQSNFIPTTSTSDYTEYANTANEDDCMNIALNQGRKYISYETSSKKCRVNNVDIPNFSTMTDSINVETFYTIDAMAMVEEQAGSDVTGNPYFYNSSLLTRNGHILAARNKTKTDPGGNNWELVAIRDDEEFNAVMDFAQSAQSAITTKKFYINGTLKSLGSEQYEWVYNNKSLDYIKLFMPKGGAHYNYDIATGGGNYLYCDKYTGFISTNENDKMYMYQTDGSEKMPAIYKNIKNYVNEGVQTPIQNCRKVRMTLIDPYKFQYLNFLELLVYDTNMDLISMNKPTFMTSDWGSSYPKEHGNDVNFNTMAHNNPTDAGSAQYWQVDLGSASTVLVVVLINRKECCKSRIMSYKLELLNSSDNVIYQAPFSSSKHMQQFWFKTYPSRENANPSVIGNIVRGTDIRYFLAPNGTLKKIIGNFGAIDKWDDIQSEYKNVQITSSGTGNPVISFPPAIVGCHPGYGGGVMPNPIVTYKKSCVSKKPVLCQYIKICSGPKGRFYFNSIAIFAYVNGVVARIYDFTITVHTKLGNWGTDSVKSVVDNNGILGEARTDAASNYDVVGDQASDSRGFFFITLDKEYKVFQIRMYHPNKSRNWFYDVNAGWDGTTVEIRDSNNDNGDHTRSNEDSFTRILTNGENIPYVWTIDRSNGGKDMYNGWPYSEMIIDITDDVNSGGYKSYRDRRNEYIKDSSNRNADYKIINVPENKRTYNPAIIKADASESTELGATKVAGWVYNFNYVYNVNELELNLSRNYIVSGIVIHISPTLLSSELAKMSFGGIMLQYSTLSATNVSDAFRNAFPESWVSGVTIGGYRGLQGQTDDTQLFTSKIILEPKFIFFPNTVMASKIKIGYYEGYINPVYGSDRSLKFRVGVLVKGATGIDNGIIYDGFTMSMFGNSSD